MSTPERPNKIGKYEILSTVGRGAMGVVYSAVDPALGRPVAIKTMSVSSPDEAEFRLRFLREARSVGQLQHPNIITVHELFEEGDTAYLVMELLEGASLSALLKGGRKLTLGEKLSVVTQIAEGLQQAHEHQIVHRDLKPSNVFVVRSGVVKVLDFGVAKVGEGELTKAGTVFGTVEYMAPEQVRGQKVTPQADIFSLGVVAYELLTGRNPFRADTLAASVFKIVSDDPEPLGPQVQGLPGSIEKIVFEALSKTMPKRFRSMAELNEAFRQAASEEGIELRAPQLAEKDIVISKDREASSLVSVEPRVSQWSHVAAQADLLEDLFQQGVEAFNSGNYDECVLQMSQVLDQVPVHAMSLHYLAQSEQKLRQTRLSSQQLEQASAILTQMRGAHQRGDSKQVEEAAKGLLEVDRESIEARWYRRAAEARLRASSVGHASLAGSTSSRAGSIRTRGARSFGFTPTGAGDPKTGGVQPVAPILTPMGPSSDTGSSGALWMLGGVGLLFLGLITLWIFSSSSPPPAVSAGPALPGVKTSPFDGIDPDGTVVLNVPVPQTRLTLTRTIPTSIVGGQTTQLGLFGEHFTENTVVRAEPETVSIDNLTMKDDGLLELEITAPPEIAELVLHVEDPKNGKARVSVAIREREPSPE